MIQQGNVYYGLAVNYFFIALHPLRQKEMAGIGLKEFVDPTMDVEFERASPMNYHDLTWYAEEVGWGGISATLAKLVESKRRGVIAYAFEC